MSASGSVASAVAQWLPKGKGKAKGKSLSCSDVSGKQVESKRVASKRTKWLAKAPAPVKQKWLAVRKSGPGSTQRKQEFTTKMFEDPEFKDGYWQMEVTSGIQKKDKVKGHWMNKERAITEHGGKDGAAEVVQSKIDAGIYEENTDRHRKRWENVTVHMVKICEAQDSIERARGWQSRLRGGTCVSAVDFEERAKKMIRLDDEDDDTDQMPGKK